MTKFDTSQTRGRWPGILAALGVPEKTLSKRNCPCPFCADGGGKDRFRFTDQDGAGVWICNQCGTGNGYHFVQRWENTDFKGACEKIAAILPQTSVTITPPPTDASKRLNSVWRRSVPLTPECDAYKYLLFRSVIDDDFAGSRDLRFCASMPYYDGGKRTGLYHALVAMVRDIDGTPTTLHVTYLNGSVKADVPSPKKVLSAMGESAHIELFPFERGTLNVAEGIETSLAVHRHTFGEPVWATISAGGMKAFVPPYDVTRLVIWGDNDENYTGQLAAYTLANRVRSASLAVDVRIPSGPGDWADGPPDY